VTVPSGHGDVPGRQSQQPGSHGEPGTDVRAITNLGPRKAGKAGKAGKIGKTVGKVVASCKQLLMSWMICETFKSY